MKIKSKILIITILAFMTYFAITFNNNVEAANASITGSDTVTEGETVTITATVNAGAWNLTFSGAGKTEKIVGTTQTTANASETKTITFTAGAAGTTYNITLNGDMTDYTTDQTEIVTRQKTIKVIAKETTNNNNNNSSNNQSNNNNEGTTNNTNTTKEKSSNANLSNLGITPNDFSGFKSGTTTYNVTVPNDVTTVNVYAKKGHDKQTISGTGNKTLEVGSNTANVVVTAEDGTKKTYTINITRQEEKVEEDKDEDEDKEIVENTENEQIEFGLSELKIDNFKLEPEFKANTYEYNIDLDEDIDKLEITAKATEENAKIEITGNEELTEGKNIITILVTNEKEEITKTYQIVVNKKANKSEQAAINEELLEETKKLETIKRTIIIAIIALIILIIAIYLIIRYRRSRMYDEEYDGIPYSGLNNEDEEYSGYEEEVYEDEIEQNSKRNRRGRRFK